MNGGSLASGSLVEAFLLCSRWGSLSSAEMQRREAWRYGDAEM